MTPTPLVSVLMRTTGRAALLRRALESVRAQSYAHLEVVLIEDGPATLDGVLADFGQLNVVYRALGRRAGRCVAGNEALRLAKGDYFVFLDDDDEFYPEHVERLVAAARDSGNRVVYSWAMEVPSRYSPSGDRVIRQGAPRPFSHRPFSQLALLDDNYLPINTVLFHRSVYETCGGFDPELDRLEDWNLWVRYSSHNGPFTCVPEVTALYRVPIDAGVNRRRDAELAACVQRAREKHAALRFVFDGQQLLSEYERVRAKPALHRQLLLRFPSLRLAADGVRSLVDRVATRAQAPRV